MGTVLEALWHELPRGKRLNMSVTTLVLAIAASLLATAAPVLAARTPIAASTARTYLATLTVVADSNSPPYNRALFPTWDIISGKCDTRQTVLKRDGTSVVTDSSCRITSGRWVSPYDGVSANLASDLDIDHVVPLKEAWVSGARLWTTAQREAFANDLTRPQLVAVTDNLVQSKGDRDIAHWVPPLASFVCQYTRAWIEVKHFYQLSIDLAEKTALTKILASC